MRPIFASLLTMAMLAHPAIAIASSDAATWRAFSPTEKAAFLKGVATGIQSGQSALAVAGHGLPGEPDAAAYQAFVQTHVPELAAHLDKAYANANEQIGIGALVASYYFAHDAAAKKKLGDTNKARMEKLLQPSPKR